MQYLLHVSIIVVIYIILTVACDLLAGHTGLVSMSYAAFCGLGAYTAALSAVCLGLSFGLGLLLGMTLSALLSLVVSLPSLRLRGDYFAIATFALQIVATTILMNWTALTRGPTGVAGIPALVIFGWRVTSHSEFLLLSTIFASIACGVVHLIASSPFGRVLHAIREDEGFAKSFGKNVLWFKMSAFSVGAALAAAAGCLYASYIGYIDPTSFTITESIMVISMVIIGGAGSISGAIIGALVLVTLPEALRFIGFSPIAAASLRQVIYGLSLVLIVIFRPQGLVGCYCHRKGGMYVGRDM